MSIQSSQEADRRLVSDPSLLSEEDIQGLFPWMRTLSEAAVRRLNAELALKQIQSVKSFDKSSRSLTILIAAMTFLMLLLAAVSVWIAYLSYKIVSIHPQ